MTRYEIKRGRWGLYFYDNDLLINIDLNIILEKLNDYDDWLKENYI